MDGRAGPDDLTRVLSTVGELAQRLRRTAVAHALAEQTAAFLASLTDDLRSKAAFGFDDSERTNWHFVPNRYPGVGLGSLDLDQRRRVHRILRTALSGRGYFETVDVFALEGVLRDL